MIHYTCDVCGKPLAADYKRPKTKNERALASICGCSDVCPDCVDAGSLVNVAEILIGKWRECIGLSDCTGHADQNPKKESEATESEFRAHDNLPKFTGKSGGEKQAILMRMLLYRDKMGLGCWNALCELAGKSITPDLCRGICIGQVSPEIADWRKINKALDKLGFVSAEEAGHGQSN